VSSISSVCSSFSALLYSSLLRVGEKIHRNCRLGPS
jgi:hypothetical protein